MFVAHRWGPKILLQSLPGSKMAISSTNTQFTVDLPLKIETYYDSFPYRLVGASVLIELTARVERDPNDETQEIKYYPDLLRSLGPGGLKHILCMRPETFKGDSPRNYSSTLTPHHKLRHVTPPTPQPSKYPLLVHGDTP